MNEQTFQPGELVNITIRGARVVGMNAEDVLCIEYVTDSPDLTGDKTFKNNIVISSPQMTVVRVAPAEWPPQPGDLWRGRNDSLWFAYWEPSHGDNYGTLSSAYIAMKASDPTHYHHHVRPDRLLLDYGPLTLVHREHPDPDDEQVADEIDRAFGGDQG